MNALLAMGAAIMMLSAGYDLFQAMVVGALLLIGWSLYDIGAEMKEE